MNYSNTQIFEEMKRRSINFLGFPLLFLSFVILSLESPVEGFVAPVSFHRHAVLESDLILQFATSSDENSNSDPPISSLVKIPDFMLAPTEANEIDLEENQRLVCLGDVHGDLQALRDFLEIAGVCEGDKWIGNNTILVQCGDILDRGSEELACYSLLSKLSHEAQEEGGNVILLLGNHESLNAMGLFQYTTSDREYEELVGRIVDKELDTQNWRAQYVGNQPARWATFEPGGLLAKSLMANMKIAVKVGRTVCVHAGLTDEHLKDFGGLEGMNREAQEWFTASAEDGKVKFNNKGEYANLRQPWVDAEERQSFYIKSVPKFLDGGIGESSPIWMRDYSSPNDRPPQNPKAQSMIDTTLKSLDCDRMVMGHTVQRQINSALEGKAWRIDVGASRGVMGGTPEILEVVKTDGEEVVSVLNKDGRIPAKEREIMEFSFLL